MTPYRISDAGQRNIQAIYGYIAERSLPNADRVLAKFLKEFDLIASMPGIGHTRQELHDDSLRVISVYNYLVIYDPTAKPLEILRVIHGARDLEKAFAEDDDEK